MLKSPIGAACATVLVALACGLATPTASHAAVYGGVFDPENESYRWFGTHLFTVDDACLDGDGWKQVNSYDGCGNAQLTGGDLTVVNKQPPSGPEVSKTLQFSDFGFIPTETEPFFAPVWGVYIQDGELIGVDTWEIGAFTFDDPGLTHGGDWYLRWSSGQGDFCDLYSCARPDRPGFAPSGGPAPVPNGNSPTVFLTNTEVVLPQGATTSYLRVPDATSIPEPTTVSLVLAALGAGWLGTRTRRRR